MSFGHTMEKEPEWEIKKKNNEQIVEDFNRLSKQIDGMDTEIKAYLADGKRDNPYIRLEKLTHAVHDYEKQNRKLWSYADKDTRYMLENIQSKFFYFNKSWEQWKQDADNLRAEERRKEKHYAAPKPEEFRENKANPIKQTNHNI